MRKKLILLALTLLSLTAHAYKAVKCIGIVNFVEDKSTMEGRLNLSVEQNDQGEWILENRFNLGQKTVDDNGLFQASSYNWTTNKLICQKAAEVNYDSNTKTLKFRYQYNSGFNGGGCQYTEGTFTGCTEE